MAILLLFQEHDTLKYSEMSDLLQLNTEQYQEHIDILVESKLLLIDGDVSKFGDKHFQLTLNKTTPCISVYL